MHPNSAETIERQYEDLVLEHQAILFKYRPAVDAALSDIAQNNPESVTYAHMFVCATFQKLTPVPKVNGKFGVPLLSPALDHATELCLKG